jgi:integrase
VWEIRICVGRDPVTHRSQQRSVTVRGDQVAANRVRAELVCAAAMSLHASPRLPSARLIRIGELMSAWVVAEHEWRPSTVAGNRSIVRTLATDPLLAGRVTDLTSSGMRTTVTRWEMAGASVATRSARVRALRSALTWGYDERLVDTHPLRFFRGPGRCPPRRPLSDDDVRRLLSAAAETKDKAATQGDGQDRRQVMIRHRAEQNLLLVRLAADTGARRGELAALHRDDLEGRALRIERALSGRHLLPPKSGHPRWLTVGTHTAELWHDLAQSWRCREGDELGPWLFSSDLAHQHHLGAEVLGHRFADIRAQAGVPEATLHRLRHSVATFLVASGRVLQAQARLGHADAATTLREYAYALPLTDSNVADAIDDHLNCTS